MIETTPAMELLARAIDVSALKQSVYAANIANANVAGYRRMEVSFDRELERMSLMMSGSPGAFDASLATAPSVVPTQAVVKLDEEMALMAQNSLRYRVLLGAIERSFGTLQLAVREGRS
jgi:flagellar basal body rod protein FlgB